ncbi:hypothetical protein LJC59_02070 [Desulfovibrio sp. OttesenSCG-928-A18]|nr:hypothetical protein [Desulfovibrio sp. OttesenSCG-928-A18]
MFARLSFTRRLGLLLLCVPGLCACAGTGASDPSLALGLGTHGSGVAIMTEGVSVGLGGFYGGHRGYYPRSGGGIQVGLNPAALGSSGYSSGSAVPVRPLPPPAREDERPGAPLPPPAPAGAAIRAGEGELPAGGRPITLRSVTLPHSSEAELAGQAVAPGAQRPPVTEQSRAAWNRYDSLYPSLLPYYQGQKTP